MKKFCIDYRNGALGNTVLAHILFASNRCQLDLDNFFSPTGDAHNITNLNQTSLSARHLVEYPCADIECVLQIVTVDWMEVLRKKMGYTKWAKCEPALSTWHKFYDNHYSIDLARTWNDFYHKIKDKTWPVCQSLDQVTKLPKHVFEEIQQRWVEPEFSISDENQLLEFLTLSYFDDFQNAGAKLSQGKLYHLDQYLQGDSDPLESTSKFLGWTWDRGKSTAFYQVMIETNASYLTWLDLMRVCYQNFVAGHYQLTEYKTWEIAICLAKLCFDTACDPKNIDWTTIHCWPVNDSVKLSKRIGT